MNNNCQHSRWLRCFPFKACPCRSWFSCVECWAQEAASVSEYQGEVQCKRHHPITGWWWFIFSPVFWLRFIQGTGVTRLEQMKRNNWIIITICFLFAGAFLLALSLNIQKGVAVLIPLCLWNFIFPFYPAAAWRFNTMWSIPFTMSFWTFAILGIAKTEIPEGHEWIQAINLVCSVIGYIIIIWSQIYVDHYDFYVFYNKICDVVIAQPPEMSMNSVFGNQQLSIEGISTTTIGEQESPEGEQQQIEGIITQ